LGAPRVLGFSSTYARERLARLFYTDTYDPGRGGIYHPRETRHVVEINLGVLTLLGIDALRDPESGRGVAEQALAARTAGRGGQSDSRSSRTFLRCPVGPGRGIDRQE